MTQPKQTFAEFTAGRLFVVISDFGPHGCEGYANDFPTAMGYFSDYRADGKPVVVWAIQLGEPTVDATDLFDAELAKEVSHR